ncbi:hypothetical protein K1719_019429 [Acacia pycnantha]|nr:hypothetical protein K1719_019429 [Acacia pycnantha]
MMMNEQRAKLSHKTAIKGGLILLTIHKSIKRKHIFNVVAARSVVVKKKMMMKKESVVVAVMVVLVVVAQVQAQYGPPAHPAESGNRPPPKRCASKCALKCLLGLRLQPISYMTCFSMCMLKCRFLPSDSTFNCTSSCAHSKTHNLANTATEAQKVEGFVESCYDNCSKH